jgi:hypothetical protein
MGDDERLDELLPGMFGSAKISAADEDDAFRHVVGRAHRRIRRRRLATAATTAFLVTIGFAAVAANREGPTREVRVQPMPSATQSTTTVSLPQRVKLGPCLESEPPTPLNKLNSGIRGLESKLVPIGVTTVRVCAYGHVLHGPSLLRFGQLAGPAAVDLANTANGMRVAPRQNLSLCGSGLPPFLITFANDTQQVTLASYCVVSNGALNTSASETWFNKLNLALTNNCYPAPSNTVRPDLTCVLARGTIRGTLRQGGALIPPPSTCLTNPPSTSKRCPATRHQPGAQIAGTVIFTAANGTRHEVATTATQPFNVELPLGIYRVTATTALTTATCQPQPAGPFMLLNRTVWTIEVVCK